MLQRYILLYSLALVAQTLQSATILSSIAAEEMENYYLKIYHFTAVCFSTTKTLEAFETCVALNLRDLPLPLETKQKVTKSLYPPFRYPFRWK